MKVQRTLKYFPAPAKVLMTVMVMLLALVIVQGIVIGIDETIIATRRRVTAKKTEEKLSEAEEQLKKIRDASKRFLPDGTVHQVHTHRPLPHDKTQKFNEIYDATGNLLWQGPDKDRPYEYLSWPTARGWREGFNEKRMKEIQIITPAFSRTLEIPVRSQDETIEIWRYNHEKEHFIGHDANGVKIGYVGATGFTDSKSQAKPFGLFKFFTAWCPKDSFSPTLLWQTNNRIYQIDFEKQQLQLLFESLESNIETMRMHNWRFAVPKSPRVAGMEYRPTIYCKSEDGKLYLIMRDPYQKLTITVPKDLYRNFIQVTATKNDIFLKCYGIDSFMPKGYSKSPELLRAQWLREHQGKPTKRWVELHRLDDRSDLELINRFDWTLPARTYPIVKDHRRLSHRYVSNVSPPLYYLVWKVFHKQLSQIRRDGEDNAIDVCAALTYEFRPANNVLNWLLSLAMVCFAFWHGWSRRTSWPRLIFWLVFAGVFNLAGLLTYLALNHTPVIKCPACGKKRGLARSDCVRCGAELPVPEPGKLDLILSENSV